jgi:hypothetical protein
VLLVILCLVAAVLALLWSLLVGLGVAIYLMSRALARCGRLALQALAGTRPGAS